MDSALVDNLPALKVFLDKAANVQSQPPSLYIDLEGNDLSRNATLSLVTIFVEPHNKVYLIDVTTLRYNAFAAESPKGHTLKSILESPDIIKLMELATRVFSKRCVNGLAKCIERDVTIDSQERSRWAQVKANGRRLFDPARGGSFDVFDKRPMASELQEYCKQDVTFMPHLHRLYRAELSDVWWQRIDDETKARIVLSHSPGYNGTGRHMAFGPRSWQ
ncbi:hypothetical protein B9Z65_7366 [Elsinoe australis]|uniref:3'-5' exonuclease domain-containing protein n=1 Tax=Elsinoe australis TaxID=40998 RepID=A0A2P7YBY0_9PEZI|nr:hypothetical protein B9Z65_7366 [Elsinoe australis]